MSLMSERWFSFQVPGCEGERIHFKVKTMNHRMVRIVGCDENGIEEPLHAKFRIKEARVVGDRVEIDYRHPIDGSLYFTCEDGGVLQIIDNENQHTDVMSIVCQSEVSFCGRMGLREEDRPDVTLPDKTAPLGVLISLWSFEKYI